MCFSPSRRHRIRSHTSCHGTASSQLCRVQDGPHGVSLLLCARLRRLQRSLYPLYRSAEDEHEQHLRPRIDDIGRQRIRGVFT